jgi:hypothetical protein
MTDAPKAPKAHIVPVWTERMGGDRPMLVCYIAGYGDPAEAREAVRHHIKALEGDDVREPSPVSDATADYLKVKPGDVWML